MRYAVIKNAVVENVIELHAANAHEFPNAVQCDGAEIGDMYQDGAFYRNGEKVLSETESLRQRIASLEAVQDAMLCAADGEDKLEAARSFALRVENAERAADLAAGEKVKG